jgi:hypothetical protein
MMKKKGILRCRPGVMHLLIFCLPFLCGWQKVELRDYLDSRRKQAEVKATESRNAGVEQLSPYLILERASSAIYSLRGVRVDMELWLENILFHLKSNLINHIKNVDDYKTEGRMSFSFLLPSSDSFSQWVQTYEIRGIPFTWNLEKREWSKEELKISGKDAQAILTYSILTSMFTINENTVEPSSVSLSGIEKRRGKDCYVINYKLAPEIFKRWNMVGNVSMKLWIDRESFLPYTLRSEGKIGESYLLQVVNYSDFNAPAEFSMPDFIKDEVAKEKEGLKNKVMSLTKEVADIRGWEAPEKIDFEFVDRVSLRDFLKLDIENRFDEQRLSLEGVVLKWLGLLPADADYKESMINSGVSSIAALYDQSGKKILMGDWIMPAIAEPIIVHEITHALQDRNFQTGQLFDSSNINNDLDASNALHALTEGEATAVMLEYVLSKEGESFRELGDIFSLIEKNIFKDAGYLKGNIQYNIYGYGANFIQGFLKNNNWKDIDRIYKTPPSAMSFILHPQTYSLDAKDPENPGSLQEEIKQLPLEWKKIYEDRIGEFYILLSLRAFLEKEKSEKAAEGWKKDRVAIYENKSGKKLLLLSTSWNNEEDAKEFLEAFKSWLLKKYAKASMEEDNKMIIARTEGKDIFSLAADKDRVTVAWSDGLSSVEFRFLAQNFFQI